MIATVKNVALKRSLFAASVATNRKSLPFVVIQKDEMQFQETQTDTQTVLAQTEKKPKTVFCHFGKRKNK